jgi:hypothetical protein
MKVGVDAVDGVGAGAYEERFRCVGCRIMPTTIQVPNFMDVRERFTTWNDPAKPNADRMCPRAGDWYSNNPRIAGETLEDLLFAPGGDGRVRRTSCAAVVVFGQRRRSSVVGLRIFEFGLTSSKPRTEDQEGWRKGGSSKFPLAETHECTSPAMHKSAGPPEVPPFLRVWSRTNQ